MSPQERRAEVPAGSDEHRAHHALLQAGDAPQGSLLQAGGGGRAQTQRIWQPGGHPRHQEAGRQPHRLLPGRRSAPYTHTHTHTHTLTHTHTIVKQ